MRPVTSQLEADLATTPTLNVAPRTVIALPPSDLDPIWDQMRVDIGGTIILRAFDPGETIITGAPIAMVTMSGEALVTMTGEALVTVIA